MLRFPRRQKTMLGLSVLPEVIHLVQLKHVKNDYHIIHSLVADVTMSALTHTLAELVSRHALQGAQTAICVPLSLVKMQRLVVPAALAVQDIETEVYAQAKRALPVKTGNIVVDYQAMPHQVKEEASLFFAAAVENDLTELASSLRDAGLKPAVMEIDMFALLRAARYELKVRRKKIEKYAVLYVTAKYALIAARSQHDLLFYKHWDEPLAAHHHLTFMQWIAWCCQAYRQSGVECLVLCGVEDRVMEASNVLCEQWSCEIVCFTASLLAFGLAMREPLPWLN